MATNFCRFCGTQLRRTFIDLGRSPLSNSFLTAEQLRLPEPHYPLHAYVCESCLLVQLEEFETAEKIFGDYLYFSSYSDSWLRHCQTYAAHMTEKLALGADSMVVEVASNDGYLLQYFSRLGVGVLGVEPARNVAAVAKARGVPTEVAFFSVATARRLVEAGRSADLICANNVLAHVPDLNDFVEGFKILLKPGGVITVEFPHLLRLIEKRQFDTIYHEHFSYFALLVAKSVFASHQLRLFDVDCLPTHGGSLRIHVCHADDTSRTPTERLHTVLAEEQDAGLGDLSTYDRFAETVIEVKCQLLEFLIGARRAGKLVVGYGAPAKGNTLLNYCGIGPELLRFTVDRNPHKQGLFLPGVQLPIFAAERILEAKPDFILILPWNIKDEIMEQMSGVRSWGGRFVVPIPDLQVF
jgi:2-polyprenyl-3-methyl-5-hydroxy-6-metoxy-1,4-benzoquinol methylase